MKSPNRYINSNHFGPSQKLYEDLIIEAIRMHGLWIHYLPRTAVNMDDLFGESPTSAFNDAVKVEVYWNEPEGVKGNRFMEKLGPEFREEVTLTVAKRRFEEVRAEHLIAETGENIEQELTNRYHSMQINGILLEEGNIEGYYIPYNKPQEGDLIWVPIMQRLFEISFVQHDAIFYQGGSLQTYDMSCKLFEYTHDKIDTGIAQIDGIEDLFSGDLTKTVMTDEDEENLNLEQGGDIVQENNTPDTTDAQAENEMFRKNADGVVDFSEQSPFVKRNTDFKW